MCVTFLAIESIQYTHHTQTHPNSSMDISVLASVGSFVVSERVLKPKASVLVILGCVLAYDLTTKTHDVSSLRVYRGPGLLAFSLMMVAYSLRTWRRNGVACDELLFLPGTPHGESTTTTTMTTTTTNNNNSSSSHNHISGDGSTVMVSGHHHHHHHHPNSHHHHHHHAPPSHTHHHPHHPTVPPILRSEGDVAAGGSWVNQNGSSITTATATAATTIAPQRSFSQRSARARSLSHDSSLSSIHEFVNNWEDDDDNDDSLNDNETTNTNSNSNAIHPPQQPPRRSIRRQPTRDNDRNNIDDDDDDDDDADENEEHLMIPLTSISSTDAGDTLRSTTNSNNCNNSNNNHHTTTSTTTSDSHNPQNNNNNNSSSSHHTRVERFRDNHPNVTRMGSLFFFRSSTTSTHNAAYAPSGPSVVGAAIDLSMPVLFNFHLFIEAWNHMDQSSYSSYDDDVNHHESSSSSSSDPSSSSSSNSHNNDTSSSSSSSGSGDASAKILPLIFLSVLIVRSFFPPGRRGRFWSTMKITACAPFHPSRFRDNYIGDVLTSLVRPFQDVVFALAYYVTVIWGSVTSKYNLSESGQILERSWILHNVVLPTIALLPLWWKFLQTLRECYDTGKRWPYLGNAFKYLTAAIVILYGMTHPEDRRSVWWMVSFGLTLSYQIFWDTVMDWDLFVIAPKETQYCDTNSSLDVSESTMWFNRPISSMRPDSYWLLSIQRHVLPIRECLRSWLNRCPSYKQIQIRSRRLYKSESFYWRIFVYNAIFRFCWMLSFIPAYHFSSTGLDVITTFSSDTHSYVGVLLPIAEILRRTLWGFLYLEIQTIQMSDGEQLPGGCHALYTSINGSSSNHLNESQVGSEDNTIEMASLLQDSSKHGPSRFQHHHYLPAWLGMQQQLQHDAAMTTSSSTASSPNAASSSSSSKWWGTTAHTSGSGWFQYSDRVRHKLFLLELSLWAMAFIGLGIWATMA